MTLIPEWFEQDAVLLAWPHDRSIWSNLEDIECLYQDYCKFISTILNFEQVVLLVPSVKLVQETLDRYIVNSKNITLLEIPTDDCWIRDYGPLLLDNGSEALSFVDFAFNGWGDKFGAQKDNAVNSALSKSPKFSFHQEDSSSLNLEPGALEYDVDGHLILTRSSVFDASRNKDFNQEEVEALLKNHFKLKRIIWIEKWALSGDDTDGHIDLLVRFAPGGKVLFAECNDSSHPDYEGLKAMRHELELIRIDDKPLDLLGIPLPALQYDKDNNILPASYLNYLVINDAVLVPTFNDEKDSQVVESLSHVFPSRSIVGVDSRSFIHQGGALHCLSMQLPKGALAMGQQ